MKISDKHKQEDRGRENGKYFENFWELGANHEVVFFLFFVRFLVNGCYKMVIFIEVDQFWSIEVLKEGRTTLRPHFGGILKIVVVCLFAHGKIFWKLLQPYLWCWISHYDNCRLLRFVLLNNTSFLEKISYFWKIPQIGP